MSKRSTADYGRRALLRVGIGAAGVLALQGLLPATAAWGQTASGSAKIKIGVIGSGHIGGTVGGLWVKAGHPVCFSSRHPDQLQGLVTSLGALAQAGAVEQAIAFGDVIFIAVPYNALPQIGKDYAQALADKVVLDATNAMAKRDGPLADEAARDGSGVTSQKYLPGTHLVRAFNTLHYTILAQEANRPAPRLAIPIAGDDPHAVQVAAALVHDAGFDPVEVGKLADARRFQFGGPGFGQNVTAAQLRQTLSLAS
ncbi:MAG: NADPH-dependent F420 reductase [Burkholderiaceae bacterium]|jgi:predicted dinucleotide-binding enzyme|nr:NADPH-dependent F420 reductase [Burkholderiaceae bacterium]